MSQKISIILLVLPLVKLVQITHVKFWIHPCKNVCSVTRDTRVTRVTRLALPHSLAL